VSALCSSMDASKVLRRHKEATRDAVYSHRIHRAHMHQGPLMSLHTLMPNDPQHTTHLASTYCSHPRQLPSSLLAAHQHLHNAPLPSADRVLHGT
jgi:hypothetical protein